MSNNDLWCNKCKSHHHPMDCLLEQENAMTNIDPEFTKELEHLINKYSIENLCDIPDFILAQMLSNYISNMGVYVKQTLDWHGCVSVCHPKRETGGRHDITERDFWEG